MKNGMFIFYALFGFICGLKVYYYTTFCFLILFFYYSYKFSWFYRSSLIKVLLTYILSLTLLSLGLKVHYLISSYIYLVGEGFLIFGILFVFKNYTIFSLTLFILGLNVRCYYYFFYIYAFILVRFYWTILDFTSPLK